MSAPAETEVPCTIIKAARTDQQGQSLPAEASEEHCLVLKLPGEDIDVSAKVGSSPERPAVLARREDAVLLLRIVTKADVDDIIEVAGIRLKAVAISPSYDRIGKLACHVVQAVGCD